MIGVVVLTYASADVITDCLDSLRLSDFPDLRVAICDNNSPDDTVDIVKNWAQEKGVSFAEAQAGVPDADSQAQFTLLHTGGNLGFAGGVNTGVSFFLSDPDIDLFWILNPDSVASPSTAAAYARCAAEAGPFALMGGRVCYYEEPRRIQSDGGRVKDWSGICENINRGQMPAEAMPPDISEVDFISGANMVASREFVEKTGLMVEDYFLYYEEIDWAARRGDLPLIWCPEAEVFHHGGTAIGTGSSTRRASPFANYFNYRNRMRFMQRFRRTAVPVSWLLSMSRVAKLFLIGAADEAWAAFCGLNGLQPPRAIRDRVAQADHDRAFVTRDKTR